HNTRIPSGSVLAKSSTSQNSSGPYGYTANGHSVASSTANASRWFAPANSWISRTAAACRYDRYTEYWYFSAKAGDSRACTNFLSPTIFLWGFSNDSNTLILSNFFALPSRVSIVGRIRPHSAKILTHACT